MGEFAMRNARIRATVACGLMLVLATPIALGHCQIPCGIYDDAARFTEMREHVTTIEKSMKQIAALSSAEDKNWNQIVRWVMNKEDHADELAHIVTYYFMAQRVKPPHGNVDDAARDSYASQIGLLHQTLVEAMKAKQTADLTHVKTLRALIDEFQKAYAAE
jgi:nickel superoxide dismutase